MYYTLLDFRYKVMKREMTESKTLLTRMEPIRKELGTLLNYYYHFFQGMYHWRTGEYQEALEQYEVAEKLLDEIPDQIEKAEFYYRLAGVYYDMGKHVLSLQYTKQAKDIFRLHPTYEGRLADCENLLGVNCIEIKAYEEAEEHLIRALDLAQKNHDSGLIPLVRYNLGFLYSEQKMSETAIRHLREVYDKGASKYKVNFLLAREYYRLGQHDQALPYVVEGLNESRKANNIEFTHRLNMLHALYTTQNIDDLEQVINEGVEYLKSNQLWHLVQEHVEALAKRYNELGQYEKASHYYTVGYEAKEKWFEKEVLK